MVLIRSPVVATCPSGILARMVLENGAERERGKGGGERGDTSNSLSHAEADLFMVISDM